MKRTGPLFRKWLFMQLVFTIILLLVMGIVNRMASKELQHQLIALNETRLTGTASVLDAMIKDGSRTGLNYVIDPDLIAMSLSDSLDDRQMTKFVDRIKKSSAENDSISEIILYFSNDQIYVSSAGVMDEEIFREIYDRSEGGEKSLSYKITKGSSGSVIPVINYRNGSDGESTGMIRYETLAGSLAILFDPYVLQSILEENRIYDEEVICLMTADGEAILCSSSYSLDDEGYVISQEILEESGLIIENSTPEYLYYKKLFTTQRRMNALGIILAVLSLSAAYFMTKQNYMPIKAIADSASEVTSKEAGDALGTIGQAISQAKEDRQVLSSHERYIYDSAWRLLILGSVELSDVTDYVRNLVGIKDDRVYFAVCIKSECMTKSTDWHQMWHQVEGLVISCHALYHQLIEEHYLAIFYESEQDCHKMYEQINAIDGYRLTMAIGRVGNGLSGIRDSISEAQRLLTYRILPNSSWLITASALNEKDTEKFFVSETSDLTSYLRAGNEERSQEEIQKILQYEHNNPHLFRARILNIMNSIIKACDHLSGSDYNLSVLTEKFQSVVTDGDFKAVSEVLSAATTDICRVYQSRHNSRNKDLNTAMLTYMDGHILEQSLDCQLVAEKFNLNEAYLRHFFNEQNGRSFWDYVNKRRMSYARKLLAHTAKTIKEICADCGYVSISTFIRTFKKEVAMTPGQYRHWHRINQ